MRTRTLKIISPLVYSQDIEDTPLQQTLTSTLRESRVKDPRKKTSSCSEADISKFPKKNDNEYLLEYYTYI